MSNRAALNSVLSKPLSRLSAATLFAFLTLFAITFVAVKYSALDQTSYQKVVYDGYIYQADENSSLETFLSLKESKKIARAAANNFVSAMHGQHWLWFSPKKIKDKLEILQIELAWLDRVSIYFIDKQGMHRTYEAGDEYPFSQRVIAFRKPAFPLLREIDQSEVETVVLRISAQGHFSLPLIALSEKAFSAQINLDYLFYGAWVAIILALGFYNATIFLSLRYNVHFYYIVYLLVFSALLITASGMGQQYMWPSNENTTTLVANIALALTNYGTAFFVIHFIRLSDYNNTLTTVLKGLSYISLLCIPLVFFFSYDALTPILICSFMIMILALLAAAYASLKGDQLAPFLLASLLVLLPCNTIGLLRFMGFFENLRWTEHLPELGLVADALILSLALAYKVNLLRRENNKVIVARDQERITFAKQLIHAKEEERKVIGKALHDGLGHKVLSIKNAVKSIAQSDDTRSKSESLAMLDEALKEVRDLSHLLYPSIIEHIGLEKAISSVVSKGLAAKDVKYALDIPELRVSDDLALLLYRAAQEFVNNLVKHSNASLFELKIIAQERHAAIVITATDNGDALFTAEDFGFGLNMLKQQAALFDGDLCVAKTNDGLNTITLSVFDKK